MAWFGVLTKIFDGFSISLTRYFRWTNYRKQGKGWPMNDLIRLIDVILDCYDNSKLYPLPDGTTYCNLGAQAILNKFGCHDFDGKTADEIYDFLTGGNLYWKEIPMTLAQEAANKGTIVFAILNGKLLGQGHGHIAVVRPGLPCDSGKWGIVPRVMNVGREMFIARAKSGPLTNMACGVNEAFVPMPQFFKWIPSEPNGQA